MPQRSLDQSTHPETNWPIKTLHSGGRFLWNRGGCHPFSETLRKTHAAPMTYFSKKIMPAKQNISNRELLALKLILEEWRHCLEGALHPFLIFTNHKNLEYLKTAKRLNSCQARGTLFFARFNFNISLQTGSKNVKADSHSHMLLAPPREECEESILTEACFIDALIWDMDLKIAIVFTLLTHILKIFFKNYVAQD